jgi:hypothetical protein
MFPRLVDAAVEVAASGQLVEAATRGASAADVVELLWERLVDAADDLQPLPDRT